MIFEKFILCVQELGIPLVRSKTKKVKSKGDIVKITIAWVRALKHKTQSVDPREQKYQ